jgi:large repetitive protein
MRTVQRRESVHRGPQFSVRLHMRIRGSLGRLLAIALLFAAASGPATAQYVGYAANSTNGTVSVFAVATSGPIFGNRVAPGNSDILISTVSVGKGPLRIAVTPSPNLNRAYVTNDVDESLWVIDVTNISQEASLPGSVTAQNVNSNNSLQLNEPGGIAIVSVTTGTNSGHVFAFVANQGNNTVSIIDTSNNTLFGTVTLGAAGTSTTVPEVTATPDGAQVFVSDNSAANCSPLAAGVCPAVWMIDATSVANGGTAASIPVSGLFGETTISLVQPRGISTTQYRDANMQVHTLVLVADSGAHPDGSGYVFVVDRLNGSTVSTQPVQIPNPSSTAVASQPVEVALMNFNALGTPASVGAAVIDLAGNGFTTFQIQPTLNAQPGPIALSGTPTSVAVANPGASRQFIYVTEASGSTSVEIATFDNTTVDFPACSGTCFNATSLGTGTGAITGGIGIGGLAFSSLDANSPPVAWFIPTISGGFGPPAPILPANSGLSVLGASMVGAGQAVNTSLSFGNSTNCTLFGTSTTGPVCTNSASGTNSIGGDTTFPASGVFTVSITNTSTNGSGAPTSTTIQQQVNVGTNCTLGVAPTAVIVGQQVQATLTCTAPVGDQLVGSVTWGDGSSSTSPNAVAATGLTPVTLSFSNKYKSPSVGKPYPLTASISDNGSASAPVSTVPVTVTAPTCSLVLSPNPAQAGRMVTATLTCPEPASDTDLFSGAIMNWGDGAASGPTAMAIVSGTPTIAFTHIYSTANTYTLVPAATDTTVNAAGVFTNVPQEVITPVGAVLCTLQAAPTLVGLGNQVTATLTCAAQIGDTLSGSIGWGDGTTSPVSATANANGSAILQATHTYTTLSSTGFPVSATATDTTPTPVVQATISPSAPIPVVVVGPPSCTLTAPTAGQTGVNVSASLACTGAAGDFLAGTINWGDGTTASTSTGTISTAGALVLNFTHSYATAGNGADSISGSVQDTTTGLVGAVAPTSVAATITFTPTVTPVAPTTPITAGQPVQVPVNFAGGVADAGIEFTTITCKVQTTSGAPAGVPPTCTVSPSTLTLDADGNGTVQVTVLTNGASIGGVIPFGGIRGERPPLFASLLALPGLAFVLFGTGLLGNRPRKRSYLAASLLFASCLAMLLGGCGPTVQRANIACTTCTTPASYTVTVTATSQTPVLTATGVFTVVVQP